VGGCSGGDHFRLQLVPFAPSNQFPFEGASAFDLHLIHDDGKWESYEGLRTAGEHVEIDNTSPLSDTRVLVQVKGPDGTQATGRTGPISLAEGAEDVGILVARTEEVAFLASPEEPLYLPELNALGDGRFLVTGGLRVLELGGKGEAQSTIQVLDLGRPDPEEGPRFELLGDLPEIEVEGETYQGRHGHSSTLLTGEGPLKGLILLAGGTRALLESQLVTDAAHLFNPETGEFSLPTGADSMRNPRYDHIAVANSLGDVVMLGGWTYYDADNVFSATNTIEIFMAEEQKFRRPTPQATTLVGGAPYGAATSIPTVGVLHCGGTTLLGSNTWQPVANCLLIHLDRSVSSIESLPVPLAHFSMVALSSTRVLVTGGISSDNPVSSYQGTDATREAWIYDLESLEWELVGNLNVARNRHASTLLSDGRVLIAGGRTAGSLVEPHSTDDFVDCVEIYDPHLPAGENPFVLLGGCEGNAGATGLSLQSRVARPSIALDPDFGVLIVGGTSPNGSSTSVNLWVPKP
jgi:hypothetical protein